MDKHGSSFEVAREQKDDISTFSNVTYGLVKKKEGVQKDDISTFSNVTYGLVKKKEGVKDREYELRDMPSDAAMATQETTYETI